MTRAEFRDYVLALGCDFVPLNNNTTTGFQIKVVNPKFNKYYFLTTPLDDREMIDEQICKACDRLIIPSPEGIECTE